MAVFKNGIFAYDNGKPVTPQSLGISLSGIQTCQQFFTSASISDNTQKYAVYALVGDLETYSIWDKMKAVYPMVGQADVSSSFEINLKDPSTFRGTFYGGWEFTNTGAKPNGSTGYMDTGLNANSILSLNSTHLSYYSRTNLIGLQVEMGVTNGGGGGTYLLYNYNGAGYSAINAQESVRSSVANPTTGFLIGSRLSSTEEKYYTNNVSQTRTQNSTSIINANIFLGCYNNTLNSNNRFYSGKECAFASIGDGLTDTEAANLYTAVQRFQTTLGRQV